jgi:hypothetical protein
MMRDADHLIMILGGLILFVGLFFYKTTAVAALRSYQAAGMLFILYGVSWFVRGYSNAGWFHDHKAAIVVLGHALGCVAAGMVIVLLVLRVDKQFVPRNKKTP